jgi:CheY-like chemotaxis protein
MAKRKILLVDDSKTAQMMSLMVLRRLKGFEFVTADNGERAVEVAQAEKPDLILMDIVMPVMDGLEATKRIRATAGIADIPIIMLTTRAEMDYIETGYSNGCNDYVNKPINAGELVAKIDNLLASRAGGEQA